MNKLYEELKKITEITSRENANVGNSPSAKLLQVAETTLKFDSSYFLKEDDDVIESMKENLIYPHDYSWMPIGTTTCNFIPFDKLLKNGFDAGHGFMRTPQRIMSATALYCIIFQANQNEQHGGQASGWFDRDLAPYVLREFNYQCKDITNSLTKLGITEYDNNEIELLAWEKTDKATYQAMESLIHNLNAMHSRAGAQVPFSSINVGTGTSKAERMVTKNLLLAYEKGLGHGEQAIFPNIVFKVKSGINYEVGTVNHDLLRLSLRVSATRLFPTYNFQDCTLNKDFPEDVPSMGCRTRVGFNRHSDKQTCLSRGNLSFTTINNVRIALKVTQEEHQLNRNKYNELKEKYNLDIPEIYSNNDAIKKYFFYLDKEIDKAVKQLLNRYKHQCSFKACDFPFLMKYVWMDCENLKPTDTLESVLKHGTLTVGCIGLAETLFCLVGEHHGESKNALKLGLEIIRFMRAKMDEASEMYDLNFSLLATPAEGLTGKLLEKDREKYGRITGVTDNDWYTNSIHLPVKFKCSAIHKLEVEGQFIKYFNGGSINYVELDSMPSFNVDAMYQLLKVAYNSDIAILAMNFPCDRCSNCGYTGSIKSDECPVCGSHKVVRIARITGYLARIENFNHAKFMEQLNRVKHFV